VLTAPQGLIYALREVITSENPTIHPELAELSQVPVPLPRIA
jgi:hypothetical protein